jgi:rhodanese-related sulfurtransferase
MIKAKFKKIRKGRSSLYLIMISLLLIQLYNFAPAGIAATTITNIPVEVANDMINNNTAYPNLLVLDVRAVGEYNTNHLHNATLIPLAELNGRLAELSAYNDTEIVVYCNSGSRSQDASEILVDNNYYNFTKVYNMEGGITAWIAAGYDYWPNGDVNGIDFALPVFLVSLLGIIVVLILFSKRRWKLV